MSTENVQEAAAAAAEKLAEEISPGEDAAEELLGGEVDQWSLLTKAVVAVVVIVVCVIANKVSCCYLSAVTRTGCGVSPYHVPMIPVALVVLERRNRMLVSFRLVLVLLCVECFASAVCRTLTSCGQGKSRKREDGIVLVYTCQVVYLVHSLNTAVLQQYVEVGQLSYRMAIDLCVACLGKWWVLVDS